jgi:tellurite resistance protein TerC
VSFEWFDWSAILIILQLVYLEGILSIDNAAVLGAMVAPLPRHDPIPWPRWLRFLQRPVHRLLGGQRLAALKAGLFGAYVGRGAMLFAAAWVVRNQWLLLAGGLYLIYLALSHFGAEAEAAEHAERGTRPVGAAMGFWTVVLNVELADLAFSLDNVVAAVALSRQMWVVLTGVFLGIVTMRFAAGIFVALIQRQPVLEAAAYLLVFVIGLEVLAEDLLAVHLSHTGKFLISLSVILVTLAYGRFAPLQALGRRLRWVRRLVAAVSAGFRIAAWPLAWVIRWLIGLLRAAIDSRRNRRVAPAPGRVREEPSPGGDGGS